MGASSGKVVSQVRGTQAHPEKCQHRSGGPVFGQDARQTMNDYNLPDDTFCQHKSGETANIMKT
jgi:hypothetical protein